ncbi:hypothetical protein [Candidatus Enterococcus courvalinii]|uniref:Acetyltransferase n=1 Tax=Candidatus Enterococcus courvalinii TaxID=2815329 RepID=A0ABS3HYJ8_9ENTE|nr:hypothetical protein [Enterococcus sp. MSG2901]MBO0480928.1 hypothetical protein [Enterococcus sp. MSG2901]
MDIKQKILNAWITIEQFSAGDIDLKKGENVRYNYHHIVKIGPHFLLKS